MATKPKLIVNGNTTTIGFPSGMSQSSINAALAKQGKAPVSIRGNAQDKALANRATSKPTAKPAAQPVAKKTPVKNTGGDKGLANRKTATPAKSTAPVSSAPVGGSYDPGAAFLGGAMDQFGYNPSLNYTPIDTSKMMDLLGKWDPSSISAMYDGAYANLDNLQKQGQERYDAGDAKLGSIYAGLQNEIRGSVGNIQAAYDTARNNINADAQMLSSAAADDAGRIQANRQAMLKNLGIEAAAPDLVQSDNAYAETGQRVTQAAGVQSNLASLLGANATAYTENTANNAGLVGAEARTDLLGQFNDYMNDLSGKRSDIDTSKASAINTGYQNWQDAYRQLGLQKMQFDMQNNQNAYNAANQNNQNAMSMYGQFQDQMAKQAQADNDAYSARMQAEQAQRDAAQKQANFNREQGLKERIAAGNASGSKGTTDLYSTIGNLGAQRGLSGATVNSVLSSFNSLAARNGLGNSPGAFADAAAKVGVPGVDPNVLASLAAAYWQASGPKASGNVY